MANGAGVDGVGVSMGDEKRMENKQNKVSFTTVFDFISTPRMIDGVIRFVGEHFVEPCLLHSMLNY